eukprot:TRINITY_DN12444_c0_g1_i1.p2 TRINITY_DN12444_c0_g1~~TRINITY_DN12444_c0_g1_i1.p2  ORF type:complete len:395 (+),score=84.39 TRINITY_DN12444_c0_g1_i1:79-1185(+)
MRLLGVLAAACLAVGAGARGSRSDSDDERHSRRGRSAAGAAGSSIHGSSRRSTTRHRSRADEAPPPRAQAGRRQRAKSEARPAGGNDTSTRHPVGIFLHAWQQPDVGLALTVLAKVHRVWPDAQAILWTNRDLSAEVPTDAPKTLVLRFYDDLTIPKVMEKCPGFPGNPRALMAKIAALAQMYKEFDTTIALDHNVHVCRDFRQVLLPNKEHDFDVGAALAPRSRWGGSKGDRHFAVSEEIRSAVPAARLAFDKMAERNVGVMVLRTSARGVQHLLRRWRRVFSEHVRSRSRCNRFTSDQAAFREALFLSRDKLSQGIFLPKHVCLSGHKCSSASGCRAVANQACYVLHCQLPNETAHKDTEGSTAHG